MKKIISLCIIAIIVLGGLGAVAQQTSENTQEKSTFHFSEPLLKNKNIYASVSLKEANSNLMIQGKPMLPSYVETYTFPFGTTIHSVIVIPKDIQTKTTLKDLEPTPRYTAVGKTSSITNEEPINYGIDPHPSSWFNYRLGCGVYNGEINVIVNVEIYPIQYHPKEKTIQWINEADVIIDYEVTSPQTTSNREEYQFVAIGPVEYSSQVAPLITHKISKGISSKFVSLDDIYSGAYFPATGRDGQEKIKYFIKNAIENWLTGSILLVGGSSKVPTRDTHVFISNDPPEPEVFVSDLYYADIYHANGSFCSWDSNANNIFGEYQWQGKTDVVDLYPDVYLTRIPATSGSQVTASVNKFIGYENTPGYQQSWFPKLVVVGGDSFEDTSKIDEGEYANQKLIDLMTGFVAEKLWVTNAKLTTFAPTGVANIKNTINSGCGFVDFNGHGNTNIWATHPHDNHVQWVPTPAGGIRTNDIVTLSNGNKLPIVTVEACSTSKFASDSNCFNWAFVYNSNGGAIGSFGCTALGYSYIGTGVTQGLIGKIGLDTYRAYKLDQAETFGELWSRALNRYIKTTMEPSDYKTIEEWIAFGDPTLRIGEQSQPPSKPSIPNGPTSGAVNTEYTYTTSTTDPEGDKISYMFNWGDGTYSSWIGPLSSGATATGKKTWTVKGTYNITVVAKDDHGVLSEWSDPLPISMPLSYQSTFLQLLERLFQRFPNAFPLLRQLLGY
ncbi:hypothetical protein AYK25_02945 [Thermoplasmatales archaeon SM1-50]|nr:MAG: hypothetical protein AYK25_02945 [Thermoplasmatales archaeon SM1-50]